MQNPKVPDLSKISLGIKVLLFPQPVSILYLIRESFIFIFIVSFDKCRVRPSSLSFKPPVQRNQV